MKQKAHQPSTLTAVIYARYSSHAQTEQSIEGQLHDCYAYAERMGYRVIGEYIDRAQSGTKDNRPEFQRMIRDAEKRQFQIILVWKLDRFARNRYDSAFYKAKLKKFGVRVVSVMEPITEGPEGIILEGILESMAEYYSANLSENVRRGMNESVRKGWFPGGPVPLGFVPLDHHLCEDERYAPIAREMFRRYADGESPRDIAEDLNARGIHTPRGARFQVSSFDMIRNPVYIGQYTYNGEVVEGAADAIIDEETFRRANARRERNRRAPASNKAPVRYQLTGKIFCGKCGAPMIGECGRSKTGDYYHYYTCAKRKKSRACSKKPERKDFVEWYVCEQTVEYILDPDRLDLIAERVVAEYDKEFNNDQVKALEALVKRKDAEIDALVDSLKTVPASYRPKVYEAMEKAGADLEDAKADLAKLRIAAGIRLTEDQVKAWIRTFQRGDLMDEAFRQRIIDTFINCVYLYDEKVVIFYNLRGGQQTCGIGGDTLWEAADDVGLDSSGLMGNGVPKTREPL